MSEKDRGQNARHFCSERMDTFSSATPLVHAAAMQKKHSSMILSQPTASLIDITGVALTAPYAVRVGVRHHSESDRCEKETFVREICEECFRTAAAIFSPFDETSELQRINRDEAPQLTEEAAPNGDETKGKKFTVSSEMHRVLWIADDLYRWSEGRFDPTVVAAGKWAVKKLKETQSPNNNVWGEALEELRRTPEWAELLACVGWSDVITLSPRGSGGPYWITKRCANVTMDLSAVSKGWTVDCIVERLQEELGLFDIYVDWGGDIRTVGINPCALLPNGKTAPRNWTIGVFQPPLQLGDTPSEVEEAVEIIACPPDGCSVCTSGDYHQWLHLVQPFQVASMASTAHRPVDVASLTLMVANVSCAVCDGLSTAMFLMESSTRGVPHDSDNRWFRDKLSSGFPTSDALKLPLGIGALLLMHRDVSTQRIVCTGSDSSKPLVVDLGKKWNLALENVGTEKPDESMFLERPATLDTIALRAINRWIPRYVAVVWVPTGGPPSMASPNQYFGMAVSSLVQLQPSPTVMRDVAFFVQNNSAAKRFMDGGDHVVIGLVAPAALNALLTGPELIAEYAQGKYSELSAEELQLFAMAARYAIQRDVNMSHHCGDHACVLCVLAEGPLLHPAGATHQSSLASCLETHSTVGMSFLLRHQSKYLSLQAPKKKVLTSLPRVRVVATVSHVRSSDGVVMRCLGTVARHLDVTSRSPPILSFVVAGGLLNETLFGPFDKRAARSEVTADGICGVVRLHLFRDKDSDGAALADWFDDTTCIDAAQQFMYHGMPSKRAAMLSIPSAKGSSSPRRFAHLYEFASSIGTIDAMVVASCSVRKEGVGGGGGYLVMLSPSQCFTKGTEDGAVAMFGFA